MALCEATAASVAELKLSRGGDGRPVCLTESDARFLGRQMETRTSDGRQMAAAKCPRGVWGRRAARDSRFRGLCCFPGLPPGEGCSPFDSDGAGHSPEGMSMRTRHPKPTAE